MNVPLLTGHLRGISVRSDADVDQPEMNPWDDPEQFIIDKGCFTTESRGWVENMARGLRSGASDCDSESALAQADVGKYSGRHEVISQVSAWARRASVWWACDLSDCPTDG